MHDQMVVKSRWQGVGRWPSLITNMNRGSLYKIHAHGAKSKSEMCEPWKLVLLEAVKLGSGSSQTRSGDEAPRHTLGSLGTSAGN